MLAALARSDPLAALVALAPSPETRHTVGQMSAVLLVIALGGLVFVTVLSLIYFRRRARLEEELASRRTAPPVQTDAWAESSRRLPLEDGNDIPREPGTE